MRCSNVDVTKVKVLNGYNLHLQFEDGSQGDVDVSELVPFEGVFEPLEDRDFFSRVSVNYDIGTICWENGTDLSPRSFKSYRGLTEFESLKKSNGLVLIQNIRRST